MKRKKKEPEPPAGEVTITRKKGDVRYDGDIFAWKRLVWDGFYLKSPYQHNEWQDSVTTARCMCNGVQESFNPSNHHRCGIYAYWTFATLMSHENSTNRELKDAYVKGKLSGKTAFAQYGCRTEHFEIVEMAAMPRLVPLLAFRYPAVPIRELREEGLYYTIPGMIEPTLEEVWRTLGLNVRPMEKIPPAPRPTTTTTASMPMGTSQALANFRYGVYTNPGPFVGRTIAEVRGHLGMLWGIPNDAVGFKGKQQLNDTHVVQAGENIEFHRRHPSPPAVVSTTKLIHFQYGVYTETYDCTGKSVKEMLRRYNRLWNVPADAKAYDNSIFGKRGQGYRFVGGEQIEWVKFK